MNFSIGTAKGWDFGVDDFSTEYTRLSDVDITGACVPGSETLELGNVMGGVVIRDSKIDGHVNYTIQSDDPMEMWIGFENCEIHKASTITVYYWGDDTNNPTELMTMSLTQYIAECERMDAYGEFLAKKLAEKMAILKTG